MDKLGDGAFSTIFRDSFNGVACAIKYADTKHNSRRYMRREVEILTTLKGCKHVVQMLDYKISRKGYIKYELLDHSLDDAALGMAEVKDVVMQLEMALAEIHSRGVVHCDLKPDNIMFDSGGVLKLIDFGNAMFADALVSSKQVMGAVGFRSPEYIIGAPMDYRIDIWALGCITAGLLLNRDLFSPIRDNTISRKAYLLGIIILMFGEFSDEFIASGKYSHRYFDIRNGNVFKHRYLLGRPCSLYRQFRKKGLNKADATYWAAYCKRCFER